MIVVEILLAVLVVLVSLPVVVLSVQVASAAFARVRPSAASGARPSVGVLVPAHNEASGIAETLVSILPQLLPGDRLLVVADNCGDDTAEVARERGAEIIVRTDLERRGKGYALDFGVRHLESGPAPEVVIVVDADCSVETGTIDVLARRCSQVGRAVQALYLMRSPERPSARSRIAEFAWRVKNWVRPLGYLRLGLPCQLMGTGMAFPWETLRRAQLANGHLVEDMKLGIDLAAAGTPAELCPEARVSSRFPEDAAAAAGQRTRWEHGHLSLLAQVPGLLLCALRRTNLGLAAFALDLAVPPLALLAALLVGGWLLAAAGYLAGAGIWPLWLISLALGLFGLAVAVAWRGWGREVVPLSILARAPLYVLGKLPLYVRFMIRRQKEWVRTARK